MYYHNKGQEENQREFYVETENDISDLPTMTTEGSRLSSELCSYQKTGIGSIALCIQTGDIYILTSDNNWTKVGG